MGSIPGARDHDMTQCETLNPLSHTGAPQGLPSKEVGLGRLPLQGVEKDEGSIETGSGGGRKEQGRCPLRASAAPVHSDPASPSSRLFGDLLKSITKETLKVPGLIYSTTKALAQVAIFPVNSQEWLSQGWSFEGKQILGRAIMGQLVWNVLGSE